MRNRKNRGNGDRSFQAGKGSKERSTKWREYYDEIAWPDGGRSRGRFTKRYGVAEPVKEDKAPAAIIH